MTDEWLSRRSKETGSLYSSDAAPELVLKLREQNKQFNTTISKVFIEEEEPYKEGLIPWTKMVAEDRVNSGVPLHLILKQFGIFRGVFLDFIEKFAVENQNLEIQQGDIFRWLKKINIAFDRVIELFSDHYHEVNDNLLSEQENIILELSAPIIPIAGSIGVMPLIGKIDVERARAIIESVLTQSSRMRITQLYIDLSGVPEMDAVASCELSKVIKGLNLLGVKTILSGMRPEVAQSAILEEITFRDTQIEPNLGAALAKVKWY
ncbi:hypothetical protein A8F94_10360 [Bacillus sp. FJAT-27225]|nr:hypothetical protein A8F94_10360 [Bacillus sp. FJAT-27225]